MRFPWWLRWYKILACKAGDLGVILGSGRSPGEGNGNPLQYSCLENSMERGAWWAAVLGDNWVTNILTFTFHFQKRVNSWNPRHPTLTPSKGRTQVCALFNHDLRLWPQACLYPPGLVINKPCLFKCPWVLLWGAIMIRTIGAGPATTGSRRGRGDSS